MSTHAFDTHKAVRTLTDAGMQEPVAEAVVTTMRDAVTEGVATETDVANLKAELKADIANLRTDTAVLKSRLNTMQWVLGLNTAAVLLMAGRMFGAF